MKIIVKVFFLLFVLFAGNAMANTCTTKTGSQNWNFSGAWTGCGVPDDGDTVIIPTNSTVTLNTDTKNIANLTVDAGGVLLGSGGNKLDLQGPGNLTNSGTVTLGNAEIEMKGDLINTGTFNAGSGQLKLDGNFTNTGTFNAQTGTVEFDGNAAQTITGNVTFNDLKVDNGSSNGLFLNGNVIVNGSLSGNAVSGGLVTLVSTCPIDHTLTSNDGKTVQHSCPLAPAPLAEYRMDESTAGSVADSTGNGLAGSLNGGVTVGGSGKICNGYKFNGTNAFVSVPNNALLNQNKITMMAWVRHSAATIKAWEAIVTKGDSAYRLHLNGGCSINGVNTMGGLSLGINDGCNAADINSGTVPVAGTWYHVAGTYDGATIKIYVNGALLASRAYAGSINSNAFPLYIGENAQQTGRFFSGDIDEVKLYSSALTAAQIAAGYANENAGKNWDGTARVCAATGPDHYELSLPATSITCLPTTVIVTACADSSNPCASVATGVTGTANLAATGGTIGVAALTAGVGSTTLSYPAATDGTGVTVSLTSATTPATCLTTCSGGSCSTIFNTAGFIFSAAANGAAATVPTQVAGVASGAYYLRAVKTNATTMACQTALTGTQSVDLGYECNDPATCYAANLMSVNAGAATLIARNNNGVHSSATPVNMTFDANGNAPFTFVYSDVGKVTLWARKTVNSAVLTGSSLPAGGFVVKPYDFGVMPCADSVVGDCTTPPADPGLTGGGSVFAKAGQSFKATVTARAFGGTATPSFGSGSNNATETVSLTHTRVAPTSAGAVDGSLGGTTSILRSSFGNGISTIGNLSWSEVGVITLTATNSTFLGNALTTTGTTGNLGRFIPDHFDTVVAGPMSCAPGAGCAAPITEMVYSGQVFKTVTVLAKNATNAQTSNYQGDFAKAVALSAATASGGVAIPTGGMGQPTFTPTSASGFTAGKAIVTGAASPVFAFATSPTAPTDVYVRAIDADSVSSLRSPATSSVEGGVKVVSGRIKIPNVYGSELLPLPITVSVQYYKNASEAWVLSTTDSVTRFDTSIDIEASIVKGPLAAVTVQSPGLVTVGSGVKTITFNNPNVAGSADICLKNPSWLITNGGLACGVSPRMFGRATFGIYKSPLIYRRENY